MTTLFLLKPGFTDSSSDKEGKKYYCPHCAMIEGVLKYYPQLEKMIEIHRIDFKRPRKEILALIGEENQNCPVLIIDKIKENDIDTSYFQVFGDKLFVNSDELIARYFTEKFGIGILH
jgi:hypothetical protein